jgi:conjugative transfer signal peptidase TraF
MKKALQLKDKILLSLTFLTFSFSLYWNIFPGAFAHMTPVGLIYNPTSSVPTGLYQAYKTPLKHGVIVSFCMPASSMLHEWKKRGYLLGEHKGTCENGYVPFLKPIAALAGDRITLSSKGATVNGHLIPNSKPLTKDEKHRPLTPYPFGTYTVQPGQVWLISHYIPNSMDGRYFGPLPISVINSPIRRIWPMSKQP